MSFQRLWLIEKARPGRYHNSPVHWSRCGVIRATDRMTATINAAFHVGSSRVRVLPLKQWEEIV